ncbi:MAG: amino acid ABC transporter substrate-binding protein [Alphaproteobacteria bacterium]|nr:amino acid ABC transporter substrate-binding protein [Alphaproteobacteria bacterium]
MMKHLLWIYAAAVLWTQPVLAADDTLALVKARGYLQCGVSQGLPGFSNPDDKGGWQGIDIDLCKGVAAAIFGNADKVRFTPLSAKDRFTALQSGEIDVLARNTTWSLGRDTSLGVDFTAVNYYDGQGFMIRKDLSDGDGKAIKSVLQLNGATICTNQGTTTELNLADYFKSNNMTYEIVAYEKADEAIAAYNIERCDAYTTDQSALYAQRLKLTQPQAHIVLPEIISKEPLAPVVRQGDNQWSDVVRWTHFAMLNAEELGVSSDNVRAMRNSRNPSIRRLLGVDGRFGQALGLRKDWAYQIIQAVGNYGESFERNLGVNTPLKIKRGVNALWINGGLQYAPPVR